MPDLNVPAQPAKPPIQKQMALPASSSMGSTFIFAGAIGWGAFLLFAVQPIMGKYILPWFGGSPAVWTTCLLFFQLALLVGYAYAHFNVRILGARLGPLVHAALLLGCLFLLPITPSEKLKPEGDSDPVALIVLLLFRSVGLPYIVLSATGPLLQAWLSGIRRGAMPYRLYALSNLGSLVALAAYPVAIERWLPRNGQTSAWSIGFGVFALPCLATAWFAWRDHSPGVWPQRNAAPDLKAVVHRPGIAHYAMWLLLPLCASLLLVATTAKLSQDVAVIPFLWVLPLGIYLITFIICFERPAWYLRRATLIAMAVSIGLTCKMTSIEWGVPLAMQIALFCAGLFICCMGCHGELARMRPAPSHLTSYYLLISAGGALGSVFVALVAPRIFKTFAELRIGWVAAAVMVATALAFDGLVEFRRSAVRPWVWASPALALIAVLVLQPHPIHGEILSRTRNFYGVLTVTRSHEFLPDTANLTFYHGGVEHGAEFEGNLQRMPTLYYSPTGGGGRTLAALRTPATAAPRPLRVGLVGMGVGTLASYARPGDYYRFYEIDPDVIQIASERFSFLKDARGKVDVIRGDARLNLEREPDQHFDAIILDAFSGDTIPVHLLTAECFQVYFRHLNPGGVIALHASNDYLDLYPVMQKLAVHLGLKTAYLIDENGKTPGWSRSEWMIFSADQQFVDRPEFKPVRRVRDDVDLAKTRLWTDSDTNLFEIFRWD